jgi:hypothetical protein
MILDPDELAILTAAAIGAIAAFVTHLTEEQRRIAEPVTCQQAELNAATPAWLEQIPASMRPRI